MVTMIIAKDITATLTEETARKWWDAWYYEMLMRDAYSSPNLKWEDKLVAAEDSFNAWDVFVDA